MVLEKLDSNMQKNETGPLLPQYIKINSKRMTDLNVRQETIKPQRRKQATTSLISAAAISYSIHLQRQGNWKEKYSMLLDWKSKYCLNVNTTQSNLHIQCNPYQNNTSILHRARTNNPKMSTEPEKTPNSQSNLEKENQSREHHNPGLQAVLESCNHQDSMVLAQKTDT